MKNGHEIKETAELSKLFAEVVCERNCLDPLSVGIDTIDDIMTSVVVDVASGRVNPLELDERLPPETFESVVVDYVVTRHVIGQMIPDKGCGVRELLIEKAALETVPLQWPAGLAELKLDENA